VIYLEDDYGRGLRLSFTAEFKRLGGEIVEADPMLSATPSLEPYLSRLRQKGNVDALVLATDRGGAELALREMGRMGIHLMTLGGDALSGIERDGPLAEGVRMSVAYLVDQPGERNAQFFGAYARAYPGERPDHRGAAAYDIVAFAGERAHGIGRRPPRRAGPIGANRQRSPGVEGVTGTIAFDSNGDVRRNRWSSGSSARAKLIPEPGQ